MDAERGQHQVTLVADFQAAFIRWHVHRHRDGKNLVGSNLL